MKTYEEMVTLFENANECFLKDDFALLQNTVSERTLCGALMLHLHDLIRDDPAFEGYFVDVEYNRNKGSVKTICKTMHNGLSVVRINCDVILHSRGNHPEQDNLIAIEMKKSSAPIAAKQKDRERLSVLTRDTFADTWSYDGRTFPEHVCRYVLGVYYEINYRRHDILIEYYRHGERVYTYHRDFKKYLVILRNPLALLYCFRKGDFIYG